MVWCDPTHSTSWGVLSSWTTYILNIPSGKKKVGWSRSGQRFCLTAPGFPVVVPSVLVVTSRSSGFPHTLSKNMGGRLVLWNRPYMWTCMMPWNEPEGVFPSHTQSTPGIDFGSATTDPWPGWISYRRIRLVFSMWYTVTPLIRKDSYRLRSQTCRFCH